MTYLQSLAWLLFTLAPLLISQRFLHREIQAVLLILTRRADLTITLFSIIFFPGVLLHESSHWAAAKLLGVRTGRLSLFLSTQGKGRLQMGYVETAETDWVRDAFIGAAPLVTGGLFVMITIGIGNNAWAGGDNNTQFSYFSYLPGSTLSVDGKALVDTGRLLR